MSATTAETLGSDTTLRVFSEKNAQRKNGYLSEKNSKEYLIEIVKEAIKEDILEEEEEEKDSTNLIVGKVVEVKDDLNVNIMNENRNVLVNGYKENSESWQSKEKFDVPDVNKTTTHENTKSTHASDTDNLINSSRDKFSLDSLEKDSLPLKNLESESSERDDICLDKKDFVDSSDKLNGTTTSNKNVRVDCLQFIQQEVKHCKENSVSSHIPSVCEPSRSIQSTCNSNQEDVHCDKQSQEINNSDVGSDLPSKCEEGVLSKVQCIGDIDGGGSSSSVTESAETKPAVEDNSYRNLAAESQLISNGIVESSITETKFSAANSLEVTANLVEKVDSSASLEDETCNSLTMEESLSNTNTLSGENKNSANIDICNVELKNKKLETDSQSDHNQSSDENFSHHSAENKVSVEVSSSRIEENVDKLYFGSKSCLKRLPRNRDENEEVSKKYKLAGDELTTVTENNSKRRSSGAKADFTSGTKKIRLFEDSNGSAEPGHIIVNGSRQEETVDIDKKNNENVMVKKIEKMPDKKEKVKEGNKLNKDKLRTKELKRLKEKGHQKLDNNTHHLNCTTEESSVKPTNNANFVESGTSTTVSKLKLKKREDLDAKENKMLNGPGNNTCPFCNCTCRFEKNDRKSLGEKTKDFMDVVSGNSENNINLIQTLEELVGQAVVDWAINKCEVGAVRRRVHYLEEEHDRLTQLTIHLKKQLDDARCIMKRIIDEKIAHKSWDQGIVPLKVTRSVGMQVCTAGSSHVLMKPLEHDKEPHQNTIASSIPITKTNSVNSNNNKCSKGTSGNSSRKDGVLVEVAANASSPHCSTAGTVPVAVKTRTEGVDKPKHILPSAPSNPRTVPQSGAVPSCVVEDDLEVQVIEPATDQINKGKIIPGVCLPTVTINPALTSITSNTTTTGHLTSGIYLLNTPPVSGTAIRNTRQVPTNNVPVTSASEIIDLTDNDHMAGQNNRTAVAMQVASRLAAPSNPRTSASQPTTKQSTLNLNAVTSANISTGSNKVITFPADSTTTYMIQRPNNTVVRKAVSQPSSSEETEVLLTSLSTLPPLPRAPKYGPNIQKPPRPTLRICKNSTGIMLSWNFDDDLPTMIRKYQVYAYQEGAPVEGTKTEMWKKVGDVDALPLPMACTLTQFKEGHKYFFVVRAIDVNTRLGEFSLPGSIMLTSSSSQSNGTPRI